MRKLLCLILAVVLAAAMSVMAVSAVQTDDAAIGAGSATVTLLNAKGESVLQTYAVGETFTAYTYLNVSQIGDGKVASFTGSQSYTDTVLQLADSFDDDEGTYNYGMVDDMEAMFPICGSGNTIANAGESGIIYYNSSAPRGYKYNTDTSALIVTHYTVIAPGEATITNAFTTLAQNDFDLTRIVDRGEIKNENFTSPIALSEPTLPIVTGSTVSGNITSYLVADGEVTVKLTGIDNDFTATVTGTTSYSIGEVPNGKFTLTVSKLNHVDRDYEITVSGDTTQDVKICPLGDISGDGKVTTKDYAMANAHAQKVTFQTGYALKCGDVLKGDGKITTADAARINAAAQKINPLW